MRKMAIGDEYEDGDIGGLCRHDDDNDCHGDDNDNGPLRSS